MDSPGVLFAPIETVLRSAAEEMEVLHETRMPKPE
jgi:hypothetical protein